MPEALDVCSNRACGRSGQSFSDVHPVTERAEGISGISTAPHTFKVIVVKAHTHGVCELLWWYDMNIVRSVRGVIKQVANQWFRQLNISLKFTAD